MTKSLAIKKITKLKSQNLIKRSQQVTHLLRQQRERFRRSKVKGQRKTKGNREQRKRLKVKPKKQAQGLSPKKPVSKPLLDTLWAKFKLKKGPKVQDYFSLSFEFSLTDKQVYLWFREKKKKYKEEMAKQKNRRNSWSEVLQACCADLRDKDTADPRDEDTADPREEDVADPREEDVAEGMNS